jgi:IclR family pca regulon transcriptional regulator
MELTRRAPKTITSRDKLHEELERIREEGLAVGDEELVTGSSAIAAPVRDGSGEVVAAVNLVVHDGMLGVDELVDEFGGQLIVTAVRISGRLGWQDG